MREVAVCLGFPTQLLQRIPSTLSPVWNSKALLLFGKWRLDKHGLEAHDVDEWAFKRKTIGKFSVKGLCSRVKSDIWSCLLAEERREVDDGATLVSTSHELCYLC